MANAVSIPILKNLIVNHCIVCNRSGNIVALHNHHIVPRAFGGRNGPQITLCVDHHEFIHDMAKKKTIVTCDALLTKHGQRAIILSYLINLIIKAEKMTIGDSNKIIKFSCELPQKTVDKMKTVMMQRGIKNYSQLLKSIFD